jgi:hypothetical protein
MTKRMSTIVAAHTGKGDRLAIVTDTEGNHGIHNGQGKRR